jgi:hypothetical protein
MTTSTDLPRRAGDHYRLFDVVRSEGAKFASLRSSRTAGSSVACSAPADWPSGFATWRRREPGCG